MGGVVRGRRRGTSREAGEDDALLRPLQEDGDDYRGACCVQVLHGGGGRDERRSGERGINRTREKRSSSGFFSSFRVR